MFFIISIMYYIGVQINCWDLRCYEDMAESISDHCPESEPDTISEADLAIDDDNKPSCSKRCKMCCEVEEERPEVTALSERIRTMHYGRNGLRLSKKEIDDYFKMSIDERYEVFYAFKPKEDLLNFGIFTRRVTTKAGVLKYCTACFPDEEILKITEDMSMRVQIGDTDAGLWRMLIDEICYKCKSSTVYFWNDYGCSFDYKEK